MNKMPSLLKKQGTMTLPPELFTDLQMDKILSAHAVAVLQTPCGAAEIPCRQELFELLDREEISSRIEKTLSLLSDAERSARMMNEGSDRVERYFLRWILVSHLQQMKKPEENTGIKTAYTTDGYRIVSE